MKYFLFILLQTLILNFSIAQDRLPRPSVEINDPSLIQFLDMLEDAVKTRDKDYIISILSTNIVNSFGGNNGIEEFKRNWNWSSDSSSFWRIMLRMIEMGGGEYRQNKQYILPYVFPGWNDKYDSFEYAAITGTYVNVRDQPNLNTSKVLGQFNYDIVKVDYERSHPSMESPKWYYVSNSDDSLKGYVFWKYVWSPIGYRAIFEKTNGEWKMTVLITGD
jgi:hypothetical protein